jgi:nucleoside-diphosphate-sugar epimerase
VDPVLERYGAALHAPWIGYLSSTGVYGDCGGAWVDETAPVGTGRRTARAAAEAQWLALGAHAFRLPGIYGPGRSAFDRLAQGRAHRLDLPGQVFSRIHVEDIAGAVSLAIHSGAAPGAWNIADDTPATRTL